MSAVLHSRTTSLRIIPNSKRIAQRHTLPQLRSAYDAAILELEAGNIHNAWNLLRDALRAGIVEAWLSTPGKQNSGIREPEHALQKLRAVLRIDGYSYSVMLAALTSKIKHRDLNYMAVEMLAGVVRSFLLNLTIVEIPKPQPKPQPAPETRDPRQVEEWLPVPKAEPPQERDVAVTSEDVRNCEQKVEAEFSYADTFGRRGEFDIDEDEVQRRAKAIRDHWTEHDARVAWLRAHTLGDVIQHDLYDVRFPEVQLA